MDYVKAIIIKYLATTFVLWIVLSVLYGVGFSQMLLLSIFLTTVGFFLGDLYILPRFENWGASFTDFFLVLAGVWVFSTYIVTTPVPSYPAAVIAAVMITVVEVFFHQYMDRLILHSDQGSGSRKQEDQQLEEHMQTEFGEEINPEEDES